MKEPKVAIYIRLSMADEDTRRSKEESDSVQHQRLLIHEFLNRHPELKDASRTTVSFCGGILPFPAACRQRAAGR